jgi:hypothetical protein
MNIRKIPWRFLLPTVILPMSVVTWVQYYLSVRASDDSPAPWYWYGGALSAWLNFPAYVYSAPAQPFVRFGIRLGKLWVEPRILAFFVLVFVFWYWVGTRIESWAAPRPASPIRKKTSRVIQILYVLGAALWALEALALAYELVFVVDVARHSRHYMYGYRELLDVAQFLWSVILAVYYSRALARGPS